MQKDGRNKQYVLYPENYHIIQIPVLPWGEWEVFVAGQIIMYLMSSSNKTYNFTNIFINFLNTHCIAEVSGIKLVQSWWECVVNLLTLQLICKFCHLTNNEGSKQRTFAIHLFGNNFKSRRLIRNLDSPDMRISSMHDLQIKVEGTGQAASFEAVDGLR